MTDIDEDDGTFGPHVKERISYGYNHTYHFFTTLYKDQNVSKNPQFIKWKNDMKKINDLIVHCPKCYAYFPNAAYTNCSCERCDHSFCLGCKSPDCVSEHCFKWWKIIIPFFGLKEYGDRNIFIKILMYFAMLFQVWFTFPLQVLYKNGPAIIGLDGYNNYEKYKEFRKKGLLMCIAMIPYQVAFIIFWFELSSLLFFIPSIIYPPYSVYWMGIFWYIQRHLHGSTLYEGDGKYH